MDRPLFSVLGHALLGTSLALATTALPAAAAEDPSPPPFNPPVLQLKPTPALHDILAGLDDRRAVFVGETHDRYDHHLVQLEVLKFLQQRHGDVALGVEWFQFPFQRHLDDYLAGRISEAQMLERTGYFDRWRYDYRLYRPIVEYARANGIPIVALNAPSELTEKIGEAGIDALPDKYRSQLPTEYDRGDPSYAERLRGSFRQHPGEGRSFDRFLDVMLTWDETMAERAAGYLETHPHRRMVVLAGAGHVAYGSGIPDRLARRLGSAPATLLVGMEYAANPGAADFAVYSEPVELPPAGLLGAFLEAAADGVHILRLGKDSAIGAAGVTDNDVILAIDDQPVDSFAAIKLALLDRRPGDAVQVRYRHENWLGQTTEKTVTVTLKGAPPVHRP